MKRKLKLYEYDRVAQSYVQIAEFNIAEHKGMCEIEKQAHREIRNLNRSGSFTYAVFDRNGCISNEGLVEYDG